MGVGSGLPPGELYRIARRLAWRYRRVPGVDLEETAQAAVTQVLEALAQLKAPVLDVRAYAQRVAYLTVQLTVWTARAPVTVRSRGELPRVASELRTDSEDVLLDTASDQPDADAQLGSARTAHAVRERWQELTADQSEAERRIAEQVLLEEYRPREAAAAAGCDLHAVYVVTARMKQRILRDAAMRALWADVSSAE